MFATVRFAAIAVAFAALPTMILAQDLPAPTGEVVLTVSGDIALSNVEDTAQFDMDMLQSLPATEFVTTTTWTDGEQTFEGVSLHELLSLLGVESGAIKATAINDYAVEIPVSDAVVGGPVLAYHLNGETMSLRDKGPLWVVYPYDANADYRSEVIYARSIWQLDRLHITQ